MQKFNGFSAVFSGFLTAIFWLVHPGRENLSPETASLWMAVNGGFVFILIATLFALNGLYYSLKWKESPLPMTAFVLAFIGTAIFIGAGTFEGFVMPVLHAQLPELLADNGPLLGGPMAAMFAVGGISFGLGFLLLGVCILKSKIVHPAFGISMMVGSPVLGLSPLMPLFVRIIGCALYGVSLVAIGLKILTGK